MLLLSAAAWGGVAAALRQRGSCVGAAWGRRGSCVGAARRLRAGAWNQSRACVEVECSCVMCGSCVEGAWGRRTLEWGRRGRRGGCT